MDRILLPEPLYLQIVRHVTRAAPMEAVGIIGERADGRAHVVIELPNLTGPYEFFADPFAQYQAERRLSREGLSIVAIYHSHPGGGTELSVADRSAGARWNCAHIVVVPERSPDDVNYMRAWRIAGNTTEAIPVIREGG
jgi:proteasome lid subunit RPN8/RPN11